MRPSEIAARKRELTEQLNEYLDMNKQQAATAQSRAALFGAKGAAVAYSPKHSRYDSECLNGICTIICSVHNKLEIAGHQKSCSPHMRLPLASLHAMSISSPALLAFSITAYLTPDVVCCRHVDATDD